MNKLCCLIIMFVACRICEGQNLVPNESFEQYLGCPNSTTQFDSVSDWINPSTNQSYSGSPDYFNQCSTGSVGVPNNLFGFQQAHSGVAYSGIILFQLGFNMREYIEVPLSTPLVADTCYHFEMFVNLVHNHQYTTDAIGAYFSNAVVTGINNYYPLPFTPQVNNISGNLFDTLNWTLVSGDFTATGGEQYLIIGNFKDDASTFTQLFNGAATFSGTYVYIDDVSLLKIPSCNTGINNEDENIPIMIFPNPMADKLNVSVKNNKPSEIIFYDITSRKIFSKLFTNSISINTEQLANGIYLYEVRNKNGVIKKGKVVKPACR